MAGNIVVPVRIEAQGKNSIDSLSNSLSALSSKVNALSKATISPKFEKSISNEVDSLTNSLTKLGKQKTSKIQSKTPKPLEPKVLPSETEKSMPSKSESAKIHEFGGMQKYVEKMTEQTRKATEKLAKENLREESMAAKESAKAAKIAANEKNRIAAKAASDREKAARAAAKSEERAERDAFKAFSRVAKEKQQLHSRITREQEKMSKMAEKSAKNAANTRIKAAKNAAKEETKAAKISAAGKPSGIFEKIGGLTGNIVARSFGSIGSKAGIASGPIGELGSSMGGLLGKLGAVAGVGGAVVGAIAAVAAAATAAVGAVGYFGYKMTSALGQAAMAAYDFRERTMIGMEVMLKSAPKAYELYNKALSYAFKSPLNTETVVSGFQQLLARGFKESELDRVMTAVADMNSVMGGSTADAEGIMLAFGQIRGKAALSMQELNLQLSGRGLKVSEVFKTIGKMIGKTQEEAQKLVGTGKISSELGMEAVLRTIEEQYGGSSKKMMKSWSAIKNQLIGLPVILWNEVFRDISGKGGEKVKSGMSKFADAAKGVLKSVISTFVTDDGKLTDTSTKIVGILNKIGDTWADMIKSVSTGDWKGTLNSVLDGLSAFVEISSSFGKGFLAGIIPALKELNLFKIGDKSTDIEKSKAAFEGLGEAIGKVAGFMAKNIELATELTAKMIGLLDILKAIGLIGDSGKKVSEATNREDKIKKIDSDFAELSTYSEAELIDKLNRARGKKDLSAALEAESESNGISVESMLGKIGLESIKTSLFSASMGSMAGNVGMLGSSLTMAPMVGGLGGLGGGGLIGPTSTAPDASGASAILPLVTGVDSARILPATTTINPQYSGGTEKTGTVNNNSVHIAVSGGMFPEEIAALVRQVVKTELERM